MLTKILDKKLWRRLWKFLTPIRIDDLYYEVDVESYIPHIFANIETEIRKEYDRNKIIYIATVNGKEVHRSILYYFVLLSVQAGTGRVPIIGDCVTVPEYRGLRIYPHVLSFIVGDIKKNLQKGRVGVFVNVDNLTSIRGIERAGFIYKSRIFGHRIGLLFIRSHKIVAKE